MRNFKVILLIYVLMASSDGFAQGNGYTNSIGMEFIRIQPGSMTVGKFDPPYLKPSDTVTSNKNEKSLVMWMPEGQRSYSSAEFKLVEELAKHDAGSGFQVNLTKPFYIGKFEVTQAQWKKVMGSNPSVFQEVKVPDADSHPVENVTWKDVQKFIDRLNKLEKGKKYRLPTEFEWEYAARAGATSDIAWSEINQTAQLGTNTTQPVGQKKPNAWGLYDMLGNVWEWVSDYYNEKIFADPVPAGRGRQHVLKGASFVGDVKNATYFTHAGGPGNNWDVGFRLVMEINN